MKVCSLCLLFFSPKVWLISEFYKRKHFCLTSFQIYPVCFSRRIQVTRWIWSVFSIVLSEFSLKYPWKDTEDRNWDLHKVKPMTQKGTCIMLLTQLGKKLVATFTIPQFWLALGTERETQFQEVRKYESGISGETFLNILNHQQNFDIVLLASVNNLRLLIHLCGNEGRILAELIDNLK